MTGKHSQRAFQYLAILLIARHDHRHGHETRRLGRILFEIQFFQFVCNTVVVQGIAWALLPSPMGGFDFAGRGVGGGTQS